MPISGLSTDEPAGLNGGDFAVDLLNDAAVLVSHLPGAPDDSSPDHTNMEFNSFNAIDTPEINPPPRMGTTTTSTVGKS